MNLTRTVFQRRTYYIDKNFQAKFIIKFCILMALGSALSIGLVYWLARHSTTVAIINGRIGVHTTAEYLLPLMLETVLIEFAVVAVAVIAMTLFFSHKIAGPLYRLKIMLANLGEGDVSASMKLRQDDQLQQVAKAYNEAASKLDYKIKMLKNASSLDEVKNLLHTFKTS